MTALFALSFLTGIATASDRPDDEPEEPWCNHQTIHDSAPISWTAAEYATQVANYGFGYITDPSMQIEATTDTWCADNYSLAALDAAGVSLLVDAFPVSGNHGQAQSTVLTENPLVFQCDMCGYQPETPVDEPHGGTREGMTWVRKAIDPITGAVTVGCDSGTCDPYQGDTDCSTELPLLCAFDLGAPVPVSVSTSQYYQWSGNVLATTPPVAPATAGLTTIADADAACSAEFGPGWRTAEFHDGWAWNFLAYGNTGSEERFWVDINDQANGTCWTH